MMVYDNLLTLSPEVEKIWKRKFSGLTLLYFLNRWVFLLAIIPAYIGLFDQWSHEVDVSHFPTQYFKLMDTQTLLRCKNFFRYPGYIATFQRAVIGTVFVLRTYCVYNRNLRVAGLVVVLLVVDIIAKLVSNTDAHKYVIYQTFELLTAFKASSEFSHLWQVILKDGFMYFLVMCTSNFTTVIMYAQDLKAINTNFGVMSNSLLTARLILNLRVATVSNRSRRQSHRSGLVGPQTTREAILLGQIGNEFEGTSTASSGSKGKYYVPYAREEYELSMQ
ncbi:hypothetical protein M0805_007748 [Coniferiporia weirii]|nr:hypothetical protein M0805_007748 [Coniferiporia weirii]